MVIVFYILLYLLGAILLPTLAAIGTIAKGGSLEDCQKWFNLTLATYLLLGALFLIKQLN